MIAIDPGSAHCGVAQFGKRKCTWSDTMPPDRLFGMLETTSDKLWLCEEWRSYPDRFKPYDKVVTAEIIGVIKYLAKKRNVKLVMQPAMIKKVAAGHMRSRGIQFQPGSVHAQDAEMHGYYFLMHGGGVIS